MKFIISEVEARQVIASRYALPQGTRVIISRSRRSCRNLPTAMEAAIHAVEECLPANLIGAIKALRTHGSYSLYDAKMAVEGWPAYKSVMLEHRCWPVLLRNPNGSVSWVKAYNHGA